jgi:hypothetical protein
MSRMPQGLIPLLCRQIESGGLGSLTEAERQIFAINWILVETNIGGLHQFFYNDAGKFAVDALFGLQAVGALETAEILQSAIALFPLGRIPLDLNERRSALSNLPAEAQWEYLGELTAKFFRVSEKIPGLVNSYIASNGLLFPSLDNAQVF